MACACTCNTPPPPPPPHTHSHILSTIMLEQLILVCITVAAHTLRNKTCSWTQCFASSDSILWLMYRVTVASVCLLEQVVFWFQQWQNIHQQQCLCNIYISLQTTAITIIRRNWIILPDTPRAHKQLLPFHNYLPFTDRHTLPAGDTPAQMAELEQWLLLLSLVPWVQQPTKQKKGTWASCVLPQTVPSSCKPFDQEWLLVLKINQNRLTPSFRKTVKQTQVCFFKLKEWFLR